MGIHYRYGYFLIPIDVLPYLSPLRMIHTLEADGIQLSYSQRSILSDIYIKCETGRISGLLGRNGSGKSCLMQTVYGSLDVNIKSVRIDGKFIRRPCTKAGLVAYMPQFNFIPPGLTISRVLADYEIDFSEFERHFPAFSGLFKASVESLSGGERRVLGLFAVIYAKSWFTLLDEPFSHISPIQVDQFKEIMLSEKQNKGFLITDHMYCHIMDISDDLYVLKNGKIYLTHCKQDMENLGYINIE
jgi:ABC-type lipopolysaccharide export system ATPase subunit